MFKKDLTPAALQRTEGRVEKIVNLLNLIAKDGPPSYLLEPVALRLRRVMRRDLSGEENSVWAHRLQMYRNAKRESEALEFAAASILEAEKLRGIVEDQKKTIRSLGDKVKGMQEVVMEGWSGFPMQPPWERGDHKKKLLKMLHPDIPMTHERQEEAFKLVNTGA